MTFVWLTVEPSDDHREWLNRLALPPGSLSLSQHVPERLVLERRHLPSLCLPAAQSWPRTRWGIESHAGDTSEPIAWARAAQQRSHGFWWHCQLEGSLEPLCTRTGALVPLRPTSHPLSLNSLLCCANHANPGCSLFCFAAGNCHDCDSVPRARGGP